ncbi:MAG: hypothetical protein HY273_08435 [Gammaproteobacteria bacterium]|nr:hypothetical protein [Gammaproteobacteria bacterium]
MQNDQVMIHVRFAPNGTVVEIGERPAAAGAQEWFNHLSTTTLDSYQSLSGGRGLFRLPREQLSVAKAPWNNGKGAVS